jgi:hypothetical protein
VGFREDHYGRWFIRLHLHLARSDFDHHNLNLNGHIDDYNEHILEFYNYDIDNPDPDTD